MKFATFEIPGKGAHVGVVLPGERRIAHLCHPAHTELLKPLGGYPRSLLAMMEQGLERWTALLRDARFHDEAMVDIDTVRLLAPIQRPEKVVGAAYNFTDALAERKMPEPPEPVIFVRSGRTVIGPTDAVSIAPDIGNVTYEAELAVVVGRRALRVSEGEAMAHVGAYTAHNDVSAVDLIKGDGGNFVRGKNLPASAPIGPWIVTPDELGDPYAVSIRLEMGGRPLQSGSTATMLHRIAALIAYASARMPLEPGDIIATGTPPGVAVAHNPPAWMKPGMTCVIELGGIGRLANPVVAGAPFLG